MASSPPSRSPGRVAVIGSGMIGRSWAMLFASAGHQVALYDISTSQLTDALQSINAQLCQLEEEGQLRGSLTAAAQYSLITTYTDITEAVTGATYIQECVPEQLDLKRAVFRQLDSCVGEEAVLASSTSALPASLLAENLTHRHQAIVAHPTNPPYFCPLVEVCPAPFTSAHTRDATVALLRSIGQCPVLLHKEVPGFVLNRIQLALMNECWKLVQDDVISAPDMDRVVTEGCGLRYPFVGPMESLHLAANGITDYCEKYADMVHGITSSFGPNRKWTAEEASKVHVQLEIPLPAVPQRRMRRDAGLRAVVKLKQQLQKEEEEADQQ